MEGKQLKDFITRALREDVGRGDHTSLACIEPDVTGRARLIIKQNGILAGLRPALEVFRQVDPLIRVELIMTDGSPVQHGDVAFHVTGSGQSLLKAERVVLNIMQRMSGIATVTSIYVQAVKGYKARIIDTRKTTPGMRFLEKEAVRIGGGENHRMGLYDMIMIKDNHIDFAGGITQAIKKTQDYLAGNNLKLKVEIEARSLDDVRLIVSTGGVDRIMFDNFTPEDTSLAMGIVGDRFETESSGGITLETVRSYAASGVGFISVGALTHHISSLDMSLKAW